MELEDKEIVYKKHFRGESTPRACAEKLNRYCDAQPIYQSLISQLELSKLVPEIRLESSNHSGTQSFSLTLEDKIIAYCTLDPVIPKKHQPYALRELYLKIDVGNIDKKAVAIVHPLLDVINKTLVYAGCNSDLEIPRERFLDKSNTDLVL